jgi:hypothetical protein
VTRRLRLHPLAGVNKNFVSQILTRQPKSMKSRPAPSLQNAPIGHVLAFHGQDAFALGTAMANWPTVPGPIEPLCVLKTQTRMW